MRTFISIDIPEMIRGEIKKIRDELPEFYGKKTESENLHLTLKFLGEIDEEKIGEVKEKLRQIQFDKFDSKIDSIGVFSERFVRIIWLHLTNCEELQKKIDESLKDLFKEEQRFMSHLTIARVKSIKDKKEFLEELKKIKISGISFTVKKFKLKKSVLTEKGPVYEDLAEYSLEN
jgi:2'-5' RNA ligase